MVVQTEAKRKEAGIEQVTQGCSHCNGFGFYSERSEDPLGRGGEAEQRHPPSDFHLLGSLRLLL